MPDPDIYYNSKLTADAPHYEPRLKDPGLEPVITSGPRLDPVEPAFNCFWGTPYLSKEGVWGCPSGDPSNPIYPPGAILQNGLPAPTTAPLPTDRQGTTKTVVPLMPGEVPEPTLPGVPPVLTTQPPGTTQAPAAPTWPFDADGNIFGLSPLVAIGIAVGGIWLMSSGKR